MRSLHKYKFILFASIMVLILLTGCSNESPASTKVTELTQNIQNTEMNLIQIEA